MGKIFVEGLLLQAGLIFTLGAQNLFVLESGMKRQYPMAVSFVCFLCDLFLILLGVAGAATIFNEFPALKIFIGVVGVLFLFYYGLRKFSDDQSVALGDQTLQKLPLKQSMLFAATFSILNPHAYLDAFVLIGGYASKYDSMDERIALGLGAATYSGLWFLMLSGLSGLMRPFLTDPIRLRRVMATAGLVLMCLSGRLALDVFEWIPRDSIPSPTAYMKGIDVGLYSSILY